MDTNGHQFPEKERTTDGTDNPDRLYPRESRKTWNRVKVSIAA